MLVVVGIGVGMTRSSRVGDGVLLSGSPGALPVPLGLGVVASAFVLERSGLEACSLIATVYTNSRSGCTVADGLTEMLVSCFSTSGGKVREKKKKKMPTFCLFFCALAALF